MPDHVRRDYYQILGVQRQATEAEVKAAYRRLALQFHPDRNPGDKQAEDRFKEISIAYAVLSDVDQRSHYDRFGQASSDLPFGPGADLDAATEFFDAILGDLFGLDRKKKAGQDLRYTVELSFEEAALGCTKTISFERAEDCAACAGTGAEGGVAGLLRCAKCEGQGSLRGKGGVFAIKRTCAACGGAGEVPRVRCKACVGTGLQERARSYDVRVPAGAIDGSTQRIAGEGAPGHRGGANGDLFIAVRIKPHPFFREEEGTLVCEVPVGFAEAALGAEIEVPLLEGAVRMKVPAGTQSGATFRIRGRGLTRQGAASPGDLHVKVVVETPVNLDDETRAEFERMRVRLEPKNHPRQAAFAQAARQRGDQRSEPRTEHGGESP